MVADKRSASFVPIREALSLPLAPFHYLVSWPTKIIDQLKVILSTQERLVNENLQLKKDQLLLRSQLQRLITIETENFYLKSLLRSSRQVKGKLLIAELLAVDADPFVNQVILDKGSRDGVYVGQPVLDANGVMGQVMRVGPITSRVLLINDPRSGIAVQNARNGIRAIAGGDSYSDKIRLMYIPKTADIKEGDVFITSGLGDHYPVGYPVGKVVTVVKDPTHQFATVYLQPSAQLKSSRQVLLVWYQRNA
ncbi:Cell shape-determining protein MreC [Aquicella lusitana]|uniref:Cell shape-determining protein MreC n=2 Tax=Aquicella lusitana TaxID=254246 RepID=A0A370GLT1_9COXI|nr:rod shape-determining protein MreC [Aquicella lusitana]VVC73106.1 Cell shape-determining protein MreC [Aquicella lusitana]